MRVDLNDFLNLPVDQPHNLGDKPLPAAASEITSSGFNMATSSSLSANSRRSQTRSEQLSKSRGIDTVVLTGISTT